MANREHQTIAFVPARGGSARIPRKNLQRVGEETLLDRAISVGMASCTRVVVSSDDASIRASARERGAETHKRPPKLADAKAQIEDAVAHWLLREDLEPTDIIVLLQPTTPFRRIETVRKCIQSAEQYGLPCVTVREDAHTPIFGADKSGGLLRWFRDVSYRPRSQDLRKPVLVEDGNCYAFPVGHFWEHGNRMAQYTAHVVCDRWESFEIDTPKELSIAQALASLEGQL